MKVAIINHSDIRGGASVASHRLMDALREAGVDARMVINNPDGVPDQNISIAGGNLRSKVCFIAERARIFASNGFNREQLFKVSTADYGLPIHRHRWIAEADIVAINWINQGMMSIKEIERIHKTGKPIVWTLHDMWPMTGICHHAGTCRRFTASCGRCPMLGRFGMKNDISHTTWIRKQGLYTRVPISFVAVSNWLAGKAAESSLLRDQNIEVIHNALPVVKQSSDDGMPATGNDIPDDGRKWIVMCAARLDDPVKGLPAAIEALNMVARQRKDIAVAFCGDMRNPDILSTLQMPHKWLGTINDASRLSRIYSRCSIVLSSSIYETLGYTLIEGASAGAIPVTFGGDGREDIVETKKNGYVARHGNHADLAAGIIWAADCGISRQSLTGSVEQRFSPQTIAAKYIDLFNRILSQR